MRRFRRVLTRGVWVAAAVALITLGRPGAAQGALPENDNFASATEILALPFEEVGALPGTPLEPGEFQTCGIQGQTAWYRFAPSVSTPIILDTSGSDFVVLNAYRSFGAGIGELGFLGCQSFPGPMQITADAGSIYYFQLGAGFGGGSHVELRIRTVPPPANDAFADALPVVQSQLESVDLTAATVEAGEPLNPVGAFTPIVASAWYVFTAQSSERLTAAANSCCAPVLVAVYTGGPLGALSQVGNAGGSIPFQAVGGTTYYIQVGRGMLFGGSAVTTFNLRLAAPPVAQFFFQPFDPSTFDTVQFNDVTFDPEQAGIASQAWDFGDGATASGCCPTHRYAADGDYAVGLSVTTADGRSSATSRTVQVRTHDVGIASFTVPLQARAGQTRELALEVRNTAYPENVQVQLFRSAPVSGGFDLVGSVTQLIPVRPRRRTIPMTFNYTFTSADAAIGKVTFQVVLSLLGGRDALPADNTYYATTPRVRPRP